MSLPFKLMAGVMALVASNLGAAQSNSQSAWFYLRSNDPVWCAVTKEADARAAAKNEVFASGQSAWLRFHGSTIESVIFTTESEDAYAEDTYTFGPGLRLLSVKRRGHYVEDPEFGVTFVPDGSGRLRLTQQSKVDRRRNEQAGHETYFVDWPLYPRFAAFPFARFVATKPSVRVSQRCSAYRPQ